MGDVDWQSKTYPKTTLPSGYARRPISFGTGFSASLRQCITATGSLDHAAHAGAAAEWPLGYRAGWKRFCCR